ncbi:ABC transporter substrate-binding protein [Streptacidiphilus melanogenes]|uniref:ABC transporter substrate-binding protein n=1 Tax=Streptacidiphilus melanogenes TaxID=411235 RepID=UPI000A02B6F9|nr:ABC transporter substrate-binding protein [Streptacidiphilus melanogenes]
MPHPLPSSGARSGGPAGPGVQRRGRRRSRRRTAVALSGAVALALVAACSGPPATGPSGAAALQLSAGTPAAKGDLASFSWGLYAEPPTLDYIYAFDYEQNMILSNVCESLMRWTPQLKEEPGLAQDVQTPNPTTFVYDLRPGVHFHDGSVMTADDAVYSLNRQLDPSLGSYWIQSFQNVASITKTGPLQVTVKLKRPDALFPQYMATAAGVIAGEKGIRAAGKNYGTSGSLDCTGPYKLGTWTKGQSVELDRFDGYWGTRAKSGKVTFDFLTDPSALTNALLSGEVDGSYLIPTESYSRLKSSGVGTLYFGEGLTTVNVNVTNLKGPLGDVRVRRALSMALDRTGFVRTGLAGVGTVSNSVSPRAAWNLANPETRKAALDDLPSAAQNLDQARALIKAAGATGKTVTIATSPIGQDVSLLATAVQSAGTQIGLNVQLKTIAPNAYTALFSDPKARAGLDMFPETYYLSVTDPMDVLSNFETGGFQNYAGFSDPAYDKLVQQALSTYDPAGRLAVEARLQKIVADQVTWIPAAEWPTGLFLNKRITGAPTTISYLYYPWAADVGAAG